MIAALGSRFAGRWFAWLGGLAAGLVFVGVISPLDLPVVDTANFFGYVLWSLWLIAFGVVLLVRERQPARVAAVTVVSTRWVALGVLCTSLLAIVIDNTIVNVALPTLVRELDADVSELQWVVDAYTLVFAGLLLLAGALGDRYGRRRTLLAGLAVFGLGSTAAAYAGGVDALIACRAVMGAGAAFIMPATLSLLISVFPDERERATAVGIWAATAGLGVALGPVVGGFLLDHFWWGSIFIVNVPLCVLAIVVGRRVVPESRDPVARRLDWAGATLSGAGLVALAWAVIEAPSDGWTAPPVLAAFAFAFVTLGRVRAPPAADPRAAARRQPVPQPALQRREQHGDGAVLRALRVPVPVDAVPAVRPRALAVGGRRARPALRRSDDRVRARCRRSSCARSAPSGSATIGMLLFAAGLARRGDGRASTPATAGSAIAFVLMGAGMGLAGAPATESIMGSLPPARANIGSAVNDTTRELGGALGVAVVGSIMSSLYVGRGCRAGRAATRSAPRCRSAARSPTRAERRSSRRCPPRRSSPRSWRRVARGSPGATCRRSRQLNAAGRWSGGGTHRSVSARAPGAAGTAPPAARRRPARASARPPRSRPRDGRAWWPRRWAP